MRSQAIRRTALLLAALFVMSGVAQAEPEYIAETDRLYLGIGCEQDAGGTCSSTEYWLGRTAGQDSVGTVPQTTTPWNYLFSAAGSDIAFGPFPASSDVPPTYAIRKDEPIRGQVVVQGYGGPYASLDSTVAVELTASRVSNTNPTPIFQRVSVNKLTAAGTGTTNVYAFEIPWPSNLPDKMLVRNLSVTLYFKGVHVLTNGFVNGAGGSWLDLPYYEVVETES